MPLLSPTGSPIIGTHEQIPGTALFDEAEIVNGKIEFYHAGGTDVDWDGQRSQQFKGQAVFVDEDGQLWLEREIVAYNEQLVEGEDAINARWRRMLAVLGPTLVVTIAETLSELETIARTRSTNFETIDKRVIELRGLMVDINAKRNEAAAPSADQASPIPPA